VCGDVSPREPTALNPRPGILLPLLGGFVATLILTALLFLAPAMGIATADFPHLVGGVFTSSPEVAFWLGLGIHLVNGAFIFALGFGVFWTMIPGPERGIGAGVVKGVGWGLLLWGASGLGLPLLAMLSALPPGVAPNPGLFSLRLGWISAAGLLGGHIAYGLALGLVTAIGHGVRPLDTLGWSSYTNAEAPPNNIVEAAEGLPIYPAVGER
jgi:hypothetical protein